MNVDEIRAAITGNPETRALLPSSGPEVTQEHIDAVAAALSVGRYRLRDTQIGPGTIMAACGAVEGAALLDALEALAQTPHPLARAVHWTLRIIDRGEFNLGIQASRDQVSALAAGGVMSAGTRDALLALGQEPDPVTARDVGLAITNDDGSLAV